MMKQTPLILTLLLAFAPLPALSQTQSPATTDLMPPVSPQSAAAPSESLEGETHPVLKISPDKSELVRLDRDAHSVIIGNPGNVTVMLDTPRLAVVIPRNPGATYFTVLDKDGKVVMQRHVVVAAPKKDYVRIRRSCGNLPEGVACKPTSVYFCPDMCHEVGSAASEEAGGSAPSTATE